MTFTNMTETTSAPANQWNSELYDSKHAFVYRYGEDLINLLAPKAGERILDLGSGTGHLTSKIAQIGATVIGLDSSPAMVETARKNYPEIEFVLADAAEFTFSEPFDAIFSNAALHWVKRAEDAIVCMTRALKNGGRLVIEFGGKGNVHILTSGFEHTVAEMTGKTIDAINYYPSISEYTTLLERHGLEVHSALLFDRPTKLEGEQSGLRSWIEMFRGSLLSSIEDSDREHVLSAVESKLRSSLFHDGSWWADYRRLRIVAARM